MSAAVVPDHESPDSPWPACHPRPPEGWQCLHVETDELVTVMKPHEHGIVYFDGQGAQYVATDTHRSRWREEMSDGQRAVAIARLRYLLTTLEADDE